ncbi:CAPR2-like protein [Mya arenaria]|uniref:CAPR2-like protein n=1 Tax=Mya arenaria TaxID=6604 RepID=A0ABY7FMY9_MYAAR|nr:uncharacterized protein LOC128214416 [Mya arenaria]WAR23583.1 CAPR2-like protein [Mya arenaria]
METKLMISFIFLAMICLVYCDEPVCLSRFDYDEKMLLKFLRIEDTVAKFDERVTSIVQDFAKKEQILNSTLDNVLIKYADEFQTAFHTFENTTRQIVDEFKSEINASKEKNDNIRSVVQKLQEDARVILQQASDATEEIKKSATKDVVAFTAHGPADGPVSSTLTFTTVVTNIGNGFDTATGLFTCPKSGLYHFIFHLVKLRSSTRVDLCQCTLGKNSASTGIIAKIDPEDPTSSGGADIGSYGVSNSAFIKLVTGDTVGLMSCSSASTFDPQSSFSGLLIQID